jgi:CRP/FNR family transcriptional regulator
MSESEVSSVPDRPANVAVIQSCSLLNGLTEDERTKLAGASFGAYAGRGEMIWRSGSPSEFVAIVGVGFVKMTRTSSAGQEVAMELLGPGQCLGLFVAIEGRAFPLNAIAVSNCWYLKIPTRTILRLYEGSSQFKDQIVRGLGPRLRKAHDMMARMSSNRVDERIAAVLFLLADSYGSKQPEGLRIDVPLTRQDISEMAGTTVESTIRTISGWQKAGIVSTERQVLTIVKEDALLAVMHES